jgi:hypothetical protein
MRLPELGPQVYLRRLIDLALRSRPMTADRRPGRPQGPQTGQYGGTQDGVREG